MFSRAIRDEKDKRYERFEPRSSFAQSLHGLEDSTSNARVKDDHF